MNFLFIVNGNGNGHQSQAIALKEELERSGHVVTKCILTKSQNTKSGNLLKNKFDDLSILPGVNLHYKKCKLNVPKTFWNNLFNLPKISFTLNRINNIIHFYQPDIVISFYDPLYALTKKAYNIYTPYISIGNIYSIDDHNFGENEYKADISFLKIYNRITALDCNQVISLNYNDNHLDSKTLFTDRFISGAIFRDDILKSKFSNTKNKLVSYFYHLESAKKFTKFISKYKHLDVTIFSNVKNNIVINGININPISNNDFLEKLKECEYFVSSSGFESTCEALFFNKKILTFPIENHVEQQFNSDYLCKNELAVSINESDSEMVYERKLDYFLNQFQPNLYKLNEFKIFSLNSRTNIVKVIEKYATKI